MHSDLSPGQVNFEHKIVLAIAIRLLADRYMVTKINDQAFWTGITKNQTLKLLKKYTELFGQDRSAPILQKVNIMTPENLHLNSFMYEPLIDMSDMHLRSLYTSVKALA